MSPREHPPSDGERLNILFVCSRNLVDLLGDPVADLLGLVR